MDNIVFVNTYEQPETDLKEIMRYSGIGDLTPDMEALVFQCLSECENLMSFKVCYRIVPVGISGDCVDFGAFSVNSSDLVKNLEGCSRAVIFAATIGIGIDRLIKKYSVLSPAKAVIFQAIGTERAEKLCDMFCEEIEINIKGTKPRFSPGYGDFPLEKQKDIFDILECSKNIGVMLSESLLMTPSKSVTAVIGIK